MDFEHSIGIHRKVSKNRILVYSWSSIFAVWNIHGLYTIYWGLSLTLLADPDRGCNLDQDHFFSNSRSYSTCLMYFFYTFRTILWTIPKTLALCECDAQETESLASDWSTNYFFAFCVLRVPYSAGWVSTNQMVSLSFLSPY